MVRRSEFAAVLILFAAEAVVTGLLIARLPDIKATNELTNAAFGLALFGIPGGTVLGFLLAPRTIARIGLTRTSWLACACLAVAALAPTLANGFAALMMGFAFYGLSLSHTEVSQNAMAGHLERVGGRRFMSRGHGAWSLGSIVGLLTGGAMAELDVSPAAQHAVVAVLIGFAAWGLARTLPRVPARPRTSASHGLSFKERLPAFALLPLCLLPLGTLAVEGIVRDWGAIFLRDVLGAQPLASTLLFAVVSLTMAIVRLWGDGLLERFGERIIVLLSILCGATGLLAIAFASSLEATLLGALLTGVGVAIVYPVALSVAARRSDAPERDVAAVSFVCFVTLMASPTLVGFLAEVVGFRMAFGLFAIASVASLAVLPTIWGRPAR